MYILSPKMDPKRKEELEYMIDQRVMLYEKAETQLRNELNFVRVFFDSPTLCVWYKRFLYPNLSWWKLIGPITYF